MMASGDPLEREAEDAYVTFTAWLYRNYAPTPKCMNIVADAVMRLTRKRPTGRVNARSKIHYLGPWREA